MDITGWDITFSTPNCGEIPLLAVQGVREVTAAANPGHTSNNSAAPDSVPAPATGDNSTQTTHNTSSTLTPSPGSAEDTYSDAHVLNATASVTRLVTLAGLRKGNISFTLQVANDTTGVPIPVDASASVVQAEVSRLLRSSSSTRDGVSAALPQQCTPGASAGHCNPFRQLRSWVCVDRHLYSILWPSS